MPKKTYLFTHRSPNGRDLPPKKFQPDDEKKYFRLNSFLSLFLFFFREVTKNVGLALGNDLSKATKHFYLFFLIRIDNNKKKLLLFFHRLFIEGYCVYRKTRFVALRQRLQDGVTAAASRCEKAAWTRLQAFLRVFEGVRCHVRFSR